MKEAHLVIDQVRTLVQANEVDYVDFRRMFQCPECKDIVKLRSGYWRSSSSTVKHTWVEPTFVHSKGNPEDCGDRTSSCSCFDNVFTAIARGQNTKKLERAFLRCFRASLKGEAGSRMYEGERLSQEEREWLSTISTSFYTKKYIEYNGTPGIVHETPELLIDAFANILSTSRFIYKATHEIQRWTPPIASNSFPDYLIKKSIVTDTDARQLLYQTHMQLFGILNYICIGASEHLRKEFLKHLIWVDHKNLPVPPYEIETSAGWKYRKRWMIPLPPRLSVEKSHYAQFRRTQHEQVEKKRQAYILKIKQFTPLILEAIENKSSTNSYVYANYGRSRDSIEDDMFYLLIRKAICALKTTNWEKLPDLYDSKVFHLDNWEEMSIADLRGWKSAKENEEKFYQRQLEKLDRKEKKKIERAREGKEKAKVLKLKTKTDIHNAPIIKVQKQLTTTPKPARKTQLCHAPILKARQPTMTPKPVKKTQLYHAPISKVRKQGMC